MLGAAISAMAPAGVWWIPLADNLWDEAGRGIPGKSHEELYKTFLLSADPQLTLDAQGLPPEPMSPLSAVPQYPSGVPRAGGTPHDAEIGKNIAASELAMYTGLHQEMEAIRSL